jgi:ferrochelatase
VSNAPTKTGVLLVNVGTPEAPRAPEVRRYLREFLSDPYVIDLSPIGRWMLLNMVILPFRPQKSAKAYAKVWRDDGSPLLVFSQQFTEALQEHLGDSFDVQLAMRYGNPSLPETLQGFKDRGIDRLILFPLYPQYALSSTETSIQAVKALSAELWDDLDLTIIPPFFDNPGLAKSVSELGRPVVDHVQPDHVLFSFHGLPERHIRKCDPTGTHCFQAEDCCAYVGPNNPQCYRAQCFATARNVAAALRLTEDQWTVTFQSRLGRTPWIQPYTDVVLPELAERGVKRLVVFCPAFVADCLETLEEIGIRAREDFLAGGGEELQLVPAVNAHPTWVQAASELVQNA